jgi:hypothetical protein
VALPFRNSYFENFLLPTFSSNVCYSDNKNRATMLAQCVALSVIVRRLKQESKGTIRNCAFLWGRFKPCVNASQEPCNNDVTYQFHWPCPVILRCPLSYRPQELRSHWRNFLSDRTCSKDKFVNSSRITNALSSYLVWSWSCSPFMIAWGDIMKDQQISMKFNLKTVNIRAKKSSHIFRQMKVDLRLKVSGV